VFFALLLEQVLQIQLLLNYFLVFHLGPAMEFTEHCDELEQQTDEVLLNE